ncbi:uncharacterized protein NPIL_79461 [Nephila pilipes]|uniref:Uncharacterized protein n=1 Tax=Nephila pilipes TaxID=299642 RepID=A0A8X6QX93_NEPPI|nr:uncharacterized protein NPIL_79461 [Nephila pilipes]
MPYFSEPKDCRGWWSSRTGLEQKLIILSTLLFILSFALVITVAVLKNKSGKQDVTTVAPTIAPTGSTTEVTGESTTTADTSSVSGETPSSTTVGESTTTPPTTTPPTTTPPTTTPPTSNTDKSQEPDKIPKEPKTNQADTRNIMPLILSVDPIKMEKSIPSRNINEEQMKIVGA